MTARARSIERQARLLSPEERERLAQRLLDDLDSEPLTAVDDAWIAEAERRYRSWKSGKSKAVSAMQALRGIRKDIAR